ncbi:unnamed protein product [Orchesella dallaii]|uniref:C2H2-type domain-containing protein n=1 Tax=Orchesella dallaii TaxID=48710 RepID=A0ABP1Q6L9_9HEXA
MINNRLKLKMASSKVGLETGTNDVQNSSSNPCICLFCTTEHHSRSFAFVDGKLQRIKRDADASSAFASLQNTNENTVVIEHLRSIFILRHLLNLSDKVCCDYLKKEGGQLDPGLWFSVCSSCEEIVQQCYALHEKILELGHTLGSLKSQLRNLMVETSWKNAEAEQDKSDQFHINSICLDIRSHFIDAPATIETSKLDQINKPFERKTTFNSVRNSTLKRKGTRRGKIRKSGRRKNCKKTLPEYLRKIVPAGIIEPKKGKDESQLSLASSSSLLLDSDVGYDQESIPSPASVTHDSDGSEWMPSENEGSGVEDDIKEDKDASSNFLTSSTITGNTEKRKKRKPSWKSNDNKKPLKDPDVESHNLVDSFESEVKNEVINDTQALKPKPPKPSRQGRNKSMRKRLIKNKTVSSYRNRKKYVWKQCEECPAKFFSSEQFEKHRDLHRKASDKDKVCLECGWLCGSNLKLVSHMRCHQRKHRLKTDNEEIPYYCDHCHMMYTTRNSLIRHYQSAHLGLPLNNCSNCDLKFESKQLLKLHCQEMHSQEITSSELSEPLNQDNSTANTPVSCSHCAETFSSKFKMDYHIAKYHKDVLLSCTKCDFKANKFDRLQIHWNTHTREEPYVCEICCRGFRRPETLKNHMRQDHYEQLGMEAIKCKQCEITFFNQRVLEKHIEGVHDKKKNHFCEYCGKGFFSQLELKRHILLHTAPRELQYKMGPFFCQFCEAKFNVRQGLYYHLKKLHSDKFILRCETCGKGYCTQISLLKHKKSCQ